MEREYTPFMLDIIERMATYDRRICSIEKMITNHLKWHEKITRYLLLPTAVGVLILVIAKMLGI